MLCNTSYTFCRLHWEKQIVYQNFYELDQLLRSPLSSVQLLNSDIQEMRNDQSWTSLGQMACFHTVIFSFIHGVYGVYIGVDHWHVLAQYYETSSDLRSFINVPIRQHARIRYKVHYFLPTPIQSTEVRRHHHSNLKTAS